MMSLSQAPAFSEVGGRESDVKASTGKKESRDWRVPEGKAHGPPGLKPLGIESFQPHKSKTAKN